VFNDDGNSDKEAKRKISRSCAHKSARSTKTILHNSINNVYAQFPFQKKGWLAGIFLVESSSYYASVATKDETKINENRQTGSDFSVRFASHWKKFTWQK